MYGHGLSELRAGHSLRWKRRDDFVLSSKVGRLLTPAPRAEIEFAPWIDAAAFKVRFDYSYDGTMRSIEDSLQRLGLERIEIAFIHDIDVFTHGPERQPEVFRTAMAGSAKALERLRDEKVVKAIGVGCNEWQVCHEALKQRDLDCFLLAGRYTLLEQDALDAFLPLCVERGAAVVVGRRIQFGHSGDRRAAGSQIQLFAGAGADHGEGGEDRTGLREFSTPLPAAALQFVVAHPAIPSFIAGVRTVAQLNQNLEWFNHPIPGEFWQELKRRGLLRQDAPTPT